MERAMRLGAIVNHRHAVDLILHQMPHRGLHLVDFFHADDKQNIWIVVQRIDRYDIFSAAVVVYEFLSPIAEDAIATLFPHETVQPFHVLAEAIERDDPKGLSTNALHQTLDNRRNIVGGLSGNVFLAIQTVHEIALAQAFAGWLPVPLNSQSVTAAAAA